MLKSSCEGSGSRRWALVLSQAWSWWPWGQVDLGSPPTAACHWQAPRNVPGSDHGPRGVMLRLDVFSSSRFAPTEVSR